MLTFMSLSLRNFFYYFNVRPVAFRYGPRIREKSRANCKLQITWRTSVEWALQREREKIQSNQHSAIVRKRFISWKILFQPGIDHYVNNDFCCLICVSVCRTTRSGLIRRSFLSNNFSSRVTLYCPALFNFALISAWRDNRFEIRDSRGTRWKFDFTADCRHNFSYDVKPPILLFNNRRAVRKPIRDISIRRMILIMSLIVIDISRCSRNEIIPNSWIMWMIDHR